MVISINLGRLRRKKPQDVVREGIPEVFPRIWRYAFSLTGKRERADDLAQSVCLRAIERADQFKSGTHLDRWLFRMMHNMWIDEVRKDAVIKGGGLVSVDETEIVDLSQNPEQDLIKKEVMLSVLRLPEAQRQTVMLVYVDGYSYRDAAMILNIPVGTIMSRLATARTTLSVKFRDQTGHRHAR